MGPSDGQLMTSWYMSQPGGGFIAIVGPPMAATGVCPLWTSQMTRRQTYVKS